MQLGWPPLRAEWTRFPGHVRSTAAARQRGCPAEPRDRPGKVGRPSLPTSNSESHERRDAFSSIGLQGRQRGRRLPRTKSQSHSRFFFFFFFLAGWDFLLMWSMTVAVHGDMITGNKAVH